ncbi:MAG: folate-binding protein [Microbacteriaceae bacterium]|nr:folate-binding protein [Microbacteriaceae bacterium]
MLAPLALPGAVRADAGGSVLHYGSPLREQRALDEGAAFVLRGDVAVVRLAGEDRLSWLNSFSSQLLLGLQPGQSAETLILSPQGRVEQQVFVAAGEDALWLTVAREKAAELLEFLQRMRFALRVDFADVSADFGVLEFYLPRDVAVAGRVGESAAVQAVAAACDVAALWTDPWREVQPGGWQYAVGQHPAESESVAARAIVPLDGDLQKVTAAIKEAGFSFAGLLASDALEVARWRPGFAEFDDRALPHEFDLLRSGVHLNKGCYRGQETVAKVHNLGHPPRRLALLHLDGSGGELPGPGDLVFAGADAAQADAVRAVAAVESGGASAVAAKPVGRLTRVVMHHEWGAIALALLKRTAPESGAFRVELQAGGAIAASVQTIVPPDAGALHAIDSATRQGFLRR